MTRTFQPGTLIKFFDDSIPTEVAESPIYSVEVCEGPMNPCDCCDHEFTEGEIVLVAEDDDFVTCTDCAQPKGDKVSDYNPQTQTWIVREEE